MTCFSVAKDSDKAVYITGGHNSNSITSAKTLKFDLISLQWKEDLPELNKARFYHGSCIAGGKLYVIGGEALGKIYIDSIEVLDLAPENKGAWEIVKCDRLPARARPWVAPLSGTEVLVMGGWRSGCLQDSYMLQDHCELKALAKSEIKFQCLTG